MSAETPAYLLASVGRPAVVRRVAGSKREAGSSVAVGTRGTVGSFGEDERGRRVVVLALESGESVRVLARRVDLA